MLDLVIFDASYFVHSGMGVPDIAKERVGSMPVGGIRFLMKFVSVELYKGNKVFIAFDANPKLRRDIYPAYKSNRGNKVQVYAQLELLRKLLDGTGIAYGYKDGYEADDVIYSVIERERAKGDGSLIMMRAGDKDLAHNIVDSNTYLYAQGGNGVSIKRDNFESAISAGRTVMFNTVSPFKVFFGDSSDTIPKPRYKSKEYNADFCYNFYINWLKQYNIKDPLVTRYKDNLITIADSLRETLGEDCYSDIRRNIELVYPMYIEDLDYELRYESQLYRPRLVNLLCAIQDYTSLKTLGLKPQAVSDYAKNLVESISKDLYTDNIAIDNNIQTRRTEEPTSLKRMSNFKEF